MCIVMIDGGGIYNYFILYGVCIVLWQWFVLK